jgi:hypothetical protein
MAFLQENNKYIRLFEDGSYKVYPSEEARLKHKNATDSQIILQKYADLRIELDETLFSTLYSLGYTDEDFQDEAKCQEILLLPQVIEYDSKTSALDQEATDYAYDLQCEQGARHEYPIMTGFYPDIKDSIPVVIESGSSF